jgi:hypothetical protein
VHAGSIFSNDLNIPDCWAANRTRDLPLSETPLSRPVLGWAVAASPPQPNVM